MASPMNYRSTSALGFVHFGHALVVGSEEGHGLEINPNNSTTATDVVGVIPAGDDAAISLTLAAKGAGTLTLGGNGPLTIGSTGAVTIGSATSTLVDVPSTFVRLGSTTTQVQVSGSTAPWRGFVRATDTAVTAPTFSSTDGGGHVAETTHVIAGADSSCFVVAQLTNPSTTMGVVGAYCGSTAGDVHLRWAQLSTGAAGGSTHTVQFVVIRF